MLVSPYVSIFWNSEFFDNFWSAFNALSVRVSWYLVELLQFLPKLNHLVSHGLNPQILMAYISKATRNWHVQHWFCHCRCDVSSFKCKNNFLTRGCNRSFKKSIWLLYYRISSFKRRGVYLILGLLGLIERCVHKRVSFISKIKIQENEIMCQFKTIRYFLNHVVWNYKLKM